MKNPGSFAAIGVCVASVIVVFFVLCSTSDVYALFTNSDTLLAADLVNDAINHPRSLAFFEFPRVPSLFPDLLIYYFITIIFRSWQWTLIIYACTLLFFMILACSIICHQLSRAPLSRVILVVLSCTMLAMVVGTVFDGVANALLFVMLPAYHSGPFLAALYGLILAKHCLNRARPKSYILLFLIAILGSLSDRLFLGAFLMPLLGFALIQSLVMRGPETESRRQVWKVVGLVTIGCVIGCMGDVLIFSHWLVREPDVPIELGHQLAQIKTMWLDPSVRFEILCTIFVLLFCATWAEDHPDAQYWLSIAGVSVAGFLLVLPLLWADWLSTRYFQAIWWWAVVLVSLMLSRIEWRFAAGTLFLGAAGFVIVFAYLRDDVPLISQVIEMRDPLEACLFQLKRKGLIGDGLAAYWTARPTQVKSDWTVQIDQITPPGTVFIWGNATRDYLYSRDAPRQRSALDFIIAAGLDPHQLALRFGLPDRVATCPESDVWIYRDQSRLRMNLGGIATSMDRGALLDHSACLGPGQFTNQSGPVPASGIDMSADAPRQSYATWGPYIGMRRGQWALELDYRLKEASGEPAIWDLAADDGQDVLERGELDPTTGGDGRLAITLDLKQDTPRLEFRTYLSAGYHFQIINLRLRRPDIPGDPCKPDAVSG